MGQNLVHKFITAEFQDSVQEGQAKQPIAPVSAAHAPG